MSYFMFSYLIFLVHAESHISFEIVPIWVDLGTHECSKGNQKHPESCQDAPLRSF